MYHCNINLYLTGESCEEFETIKKVSPLEHFTHNFCESGAPDKNVLNGSDIAIINLRNMDIEKSFIPLLAGKNKNTEIILLAEKKQMNLLQKVFSDITDIWITPMSSEETLFRFLKWLKEYKAGKDFWQMEQYFETTINCTPNLVWCKDKSGVHKKVNVSFCKTVGKTKAQVCGRKHAYIWDVEKDDPGCEQSEKKVMTDKKVSVFEETIKTGQGIKNLTTYKAPLYDIDGSIMGTVGIGFDITKEMVYKNEIMKKNNTLETIFKTLDCGVLCHTEDGKGIISVNRAALKILGYKSKEEMAKSGFDMVAMSVVDEDKIILRNAMKKLNNPGDTASVEYRVAHEDGEILHVMGNIKLLEENGERFYQRFLLDCTKQKLMEKKKELRNKEMIQALCIDYNYVCFFDLNSNTGTVLLDEGDHTYYSPADGNISLLENMKYYIDKYVYDEDKEMMREAASIEKLKKELSAKNIYNVNYRIFKDGDIKYYQMKAVHAGKRGEYEGIVLGFHSVDEEIKSEMEKKELLENALLQANRASKAKSTFLSNMSHDIRTPMNAVIGFTSLAIDHVDSKERVLEYLEKIRTSGNHLLSLINDILDMSCIESGKIQLYEKLSSMPEILHGLCSILQPDIKSKQLEFSLDTADVADEDIYCDKLRLSQVLLNLLNNSVKYTGAGGSVSMRVTEKQGAPEGYANYEFRIKDTGIGMSKEFTERIFEPFERERNSTVSKIEGTGLGMTITKNIVDMMNGSIEVKSEKGVGTEFIVSFTFRLHSESKKNYIIPELEKCRALVADDDFNTCDSVSYMLSQIGMRAEWTLSGKEAVLRAHQAVLRGDEYKVYVIDWFLPDVNGVEVARKIRKEIGGGAIIIILTAYDWQDIEDEAKEAGVTAFCSKPLFLSELKNCLAAAVRKEPEKDSSSEKAQRNRHGRILLAEDVALNQEIASTILSDAGFFVEIAENGQEAIDMVKKSESGYYQLILMDIQMPVKSGYEATEEIRKLKNKKLASIPIIAMTANAFEEDKQAALRCGMNGHIAKPIDIKVLFNMLDSILEKQF